MGRREERKEELAKIQPAARRRVPRYDVDGEGTSLRLVFEEAQSRVEQGPQSETAKAYNCSVYDRHTSVAAECLPLRLGKRVSWFDTEGHVPRGDLDR